MKFPRYSNLILLPGLWLALILSATFAHAQISPADFTSAYVELVAKKYPDIKVVIDEPLQLSLDLGNDSEFTVHLGNAYTTYTNSPDDLDAILEQYSVSLTEHMGANDSPLAAKNIVPVVKDHGWLEDMATAAKRSGASGSPEFFHQSLAEGLIIVFAEDTPTSMQYVGKDALIEANINLETIREESLQNLRERLPQVELQGSDGLYMVAAGGDYEASLLLIDSIWNTENFAIKGDIVVSVPARDVLLVSGSKNRKELKKLRSATKEIYAEATYYISTNLYVRTGDGWKLFK